MKKTFKPLIAAGIAVLVLGGGLAVVMNLPSDEITPDNKAEKSSSILLYDKSDFSPEQITVKNSGGEYTLLGFDSELFSEDNTSKTKEESQSSTQESSEITETMIYTMQGTPDIAVSKNLTDELAYHCRSLTALSLVDKSGQKFKDYGLDNPRAEVSIVFSDDSQEAFFLGNDAPANQGVYLRRSGSNNVYLAASGSVSIFLTEKLQMYDKTVTDSISSDEKIYSLTISGESQKKEITLSYGSNNFSSASYVMSSPRREICSESAVDAIGRNIFDITAPTVKDIITDDSVLEKYGLKNPYLHLKAVSSENLQAEIFVSKADENDLCYMMPKDGKLIFSIPKSQLVFYQISYQDLLSKSFISPNTSSLNHMIIHNRENEYIYDVTHETEINSDYEEVIVSKAFFENQEINYSNLMTYISNLAAAERTDGELPENLENTEKIFSIEFSFDSSDDQEEKEFLEIYQTADQKSIVVLNHLIECLTDTEYMNQVIAQSDAISKADSLTMLNESDDSLEDTGESKDE